MQVTQSNFKETVINIIKEIPEFVPAINNNRVLHKKPNQRSRITPGR